VLGRGALTLVDPATPWPDERWRLKRYLDAPVERIVLTHHHGDHVGAAKWARKTFDAPVLAHPRTRELLAGAVPVDDTLGEGDALACGDDTWRVLFTPGHASGHVCLHHAESGQAIVGDMVAGTGTIVLDPPEGVLALYLASLGRLRALGLSILHPAHGPAIDPAGPLLDHYIDHRNARTDQIRAALASVGRGPPKALLPLVYPDLHVLMRPVAARQVLAHLMWLADRGEVRNVGDEWTLNGA